jgi:hypothetical protein
MLLVLHCVSGLSLPAAGSVPLSGVDVVLEGPHAAESIGSYECLFAFTSFITARVCRMQSLVLVCVFCTNVTASATPPG